jgi:hypothetical protein
VRYPHLCPEKLVNAGRVGNQQRPTYEKDMERLENIRRNDYRLVNKQFAIEHGPVEIVDLPINSMVDLPMVFVCLPCRVATRVYPEDIPVCL